MTCRWTGIGAFEALHRDLLARLHARETGLIAGRLKSKKGHPRRRLGAFLADQATTPKHSAPVWPAGASFRSLRAAQHHRPGQTAFNAPRGSSRRGFILLRETLVCKHRKALDSHRVFFTWPSCNRFFWFFPSSTQTMWAACRRTRRPSPTSCSLLTHPTASLRTPRFSLDRRVPQCVMWHYQQKHFFSAKRETISTALGKQKKLSPEQQQEKDLFFGVVQKMENFINSKEAEKAIEYWAAWSREKDKQPNVYVYNSLVKAHLRLGDLNSALRQLQSLKKAGLKPNMVIYTLLLNACKKLAKPVIAEKLFRDMIATGLEPDAVVYLSLISVLANALGMLSFLSLSSSKTINSISSLPTAKISQM